MLLRVTNHFLESTLYYASYPCESNLPLSNPIFDLINHYNCNHYPQMTIRIFRMFIIAYSLPIYEFPVEASSAAKRRNKKFEKEFRILQNACALEKTKCGSLIPEENLNCVNLCISSKCYDSIFAQSPLEDGEVDYFRERAFKKCASYEMKRKRG